MARLSIGDLLEEHSSVRLTVSDPACGSSQMLLAVAEINRGWEFIGQDVDLRCVHMTAIDLALRTYMATEYAGTRRRMSGERYSALASTVAAS